MTYLGSSSEAIFYSALSSLLSGEDLCLFERAGRPPNSLTQRRYLPTMVCLSFASGMMPWIHKHNTHLNLGLVLVKWLKPLSLTPAKPLKSYLWFLERLKADATRFVASKNAWTRQSSGSTQRGTALAQSAVTRAATQHPITLCITGG